MTHAHRLASAEFCIFALGALFLGGVQAADQAPAVTPPKPVVIQPTAAMAPPPSLVPEASETAPAPTAKGGKAKKAGTAAKSGKAVKTVKPVAKQKPAKPAAKPKSKGTQR